MSSPAKDVDIVWAPQAGSQVAFLSCPIFEVLYEGNRGGGKSDCLLMDFGQFVGRGFGSAWRGAIFRLTYPALTDIITKSKEWFPRIWPNARYNESKSFWQWPDGELLYFRQFERESDYWKYHGWSLPWQGWEELCNWPNLTGYKRMMSLCRSASSGIPRRIRATTNPYGPGHNVVKARFRLPAWRSRIITDSLDESGKPEPPRVAIQSRLEENRILLQSDPGYLDTIRAAANSPAELAAWLDGSWDIVAGGMFDDLWDPKVHVIEHEQHFQIPHSWRLDRSFDWGSSKPFSVGWWAESDGSDVRLRDGSVRSTVRGDLFRVAEWYGWNGKPNEGLKMLASEISRGIVEREVASGWRSQASCRVVPGPADSSIFKAENGNCIAQDFLKRVRLKNGLEFSGVTWLPSDRSPGSRVTGWEQVRMMLKSALPADHGPRESAGLFVFDSCDQFLRTFPVLPRDKRKPDDLDTESEDHCADEVRYRVRASRPTIAYGRTC